MLQTGSPAPSFQLPDQDGKVVSLQDLAGRWVVLYFYPKDDTPGCTIEACEFSAANAAFTGLDAVVFGCSADSASSHQQFVAKYQLGIGLLTDADRAVMKQYGAWGTKVMYGKEVEGVIRSTVIIAPDGRVAHHWERVRAEGHAEQVRAKLAELQGGAEPAAPAEAAAAMPAEVSAEVPAEAPAEFAEVVLPPAPRKVMTIKKQKPAAKPAAVAKKVTKTAKKPAKKAAKKAAKKPAKKAAKKATKKPAKKAAKKGQAAKKGAKASTKKGAKKAAKKAKK